VRGLLLCSVHKNGWVSGESGSEVVLWGKTSLGSVREGRSVAGKGKVCGSGGVRVTGLWEKEGAGLRVLKNSDGEESPSMVLGVGEKEREMGPVCWLGLEDERKMGGTVMAGLAKEEGFLRFEREAEEKRERRPGRRRKIFRFRFFSFLWFPKFLNFFSPHLFFHCRLVFIGEVWLGHNHIGPSTLFFLYFEFILKTNNTNVDSIRKISDYKINTLKVDHVQNTFENLNFSEMMLKMLKTMQIYQKYIFLGFSLFFSIFGFFLKIYQKHG
jgi:hypothetical protein